MASEYINAEQMDIDNDAMSEANFGLFLQFAECGGVFKDVFEFLKEHDIQKEEYVNEIKPLIRKNAQLEWYELVFDVIENRIPANHWLNLIADYFTSGISCEKTAQALKDSESLHHMAKIKSKILDEPKEKEAEIVTELSDVIKNVLSIYEKESLKKEKQLPLLQEKIQSLEKKVEFYDEEISRKDNVISNLKENESDSMAENLKEQLEYYKKAYEVQVNENATYKDKITDLNLEMTRLKDSEETNDNLSASMVGFVKNTYEKVLVLEEELSALRRANEENEAPEKFLSFIEKEFNNQNNYFDLMLTEKLDHAFESFSTKEIMSEESKDEEQEKHVEENSETEELQESHCQETTSESSESEEKINEIAETKEETPAPTIQQTVSKRFKKEIKKPDNTKEDKKRFLIEFFESKKLDRIVNKFVALEDEKEQTSAIKAQILKRKFKQDVILIVNAALKEKKVTNEFIYSLLINEQVGAEEISMLLAE